MAGRRIEPWAAIVWTRELDEALHAMVAAKMTTRAIGASLGITQSTVARRIKFLGLREAVEKLPGERGKPAHIADYKKARRGFVVPEHLEREYFELLKTGMPIAAACERLGIVTQPEKRGG